MFDDIKKRIDGILDRQMTSLVNGVLLDVARHLREQSKLVRERAGHHNPKLVHDIGFADGLEFAAEMLEKLGTQC